jgi:MFS family permease
VKLLRTALRNPRIARLEAAAATATLGTWTFTIVLALYAYYEDGPAAVGLAVVVRMLPSAFVTPFAIRLAAARSRRSLLVAGALARFALVEAVALAVLADLPFAVVLVLAAASRVAATADPPAHGALVTRFARTPAELAGADVARATIEYAGFLAGALAAGVLTSVGQLDFAFAAGGLSFLVEAAMLMRLPADEPALERRPAVALPEAVRALSRHPWMRLRAALFGANVLVQSMVELLLVVAAIDILGMGDGGVGWLFAAWAAGALIGAGAALALLGHGRLAAAVASGFLLVGAPIALVGSGPAPASALVLLVLLGVGFALVEAALLTLTQRLAPTRVLAGVAGVDALVYAVARSVGAMLAAWLVLALGDKQAMLVAGLVLPAVAIVSIRALLAADRGVTVPEHRYALLRRLPLFAALPRASIENLALAATTGSYGVGDAIVRAGRRDDRLYVIEEGTAQADGTGGGRVCLREGDHFGESSLLRAESAPATVSAVTPVTTLSLARGDFLRGVRAPARIELEADAAIATAAAAEPAPVSLPATSAEPAPR